MKFHGHGGTLVAVAAFMLGVSVNAKADEFIGYGQAGTPGSWALEFWPVLTHTGPNSNSIQMFSNPAYFTKSGFTGTTRDQFEFWVGASPGYANTHDAPGASGFGAAYPEIGIEYYYDVLVPDQPAGSPNYKTFWTSPTFTVSFPNGSSKSAGFGAGANQYTYAFNVDNWIQIGKIGITANPVELSYSARNLNTTEIENGDYERLRGGFSVTLADIAAGYQVKDDLFVGIHHSYSIYSWKASDYAAEREGKIGPSFTYFGLVKYGLFISGDVDFDYYTSSNLKKSVSVSAAIIKSF